MKNNRNDHIGDDYSTLNKYMLSFDETNIEMKQSAIIGKASLLANTPTLLASR